MIRRLGAAFLSLPICAWSAPWSFDAPVEVVDRSLPPHFQHLEGAGRLHIAAGERSLAVVWEDDRDGSPQVYAAVKELAENAFEPDVKLSTGNEAFDPAVVALEGNRWIAAWEQNGEIWGSILDSSQVTLPARLSGGAARQVTLAADNGENVHAVWARVSNGAQVLEVAPLKVAANLLQVEAPVRVTPGADTHYQGYPAATFVGNGRLVVAWEDRRAGHTRLFSSWRKGRQPFSPEIQLNEHRAPATTDDFRGGTGVMRVTLARGQEDTVQAVWLDKRNPGSGYAVWGARSVDGGKSFSSNHKVQDELGDAIQQWHASVDHGRVGFVSTWDDARERWADESETADVWVSWQTESGWSGDESVPGASGAGYQGSPAMTIDREGDIHIVWIERDSRTSPGRLRYVRGVAEYRYR